MMRSLAAAGLLLGAVAASASAQQPIPLFPDAAPPRSVQPEPLPPLAPAAPGMTDRRPTPPPYAPPPYASPPYGPRPEMPAPETPPPESAAGPAETREFCSQPVGYSLARRDSVPPAYREF